VWVFEYKLFIEFLEFQLNQFLENSDDGCDGEKRRGGEIRMTSSKNYNSQIDINHSLHRFLTNCRCFFPRLDQFVGMNVFHVEAPDVQIFIIQFSFHKFS
jgi:hypothetical protein